MDHNLDLYNAIILWQENADKHDSLLIIQTNKQTLATMILLQGSNEDLIRVILSDPPKDTQYSDTHTAIKKFIANAGINVMNQNENIKKKALKMLTNKFK